MLAKAGEGRIVVVQFYQPTVMTCLQMRPYFTKHSSSHKFRRAIFAEVDVNDHEVRRSRTAVHPSRRACGRSWP